MAQGLAKLSKSNKSQGSQKRKAVRSKKSIGKGRKHYHSKHESDRVAASTTKAINKKNETLVAAKAVGVGTKFFLSDISEKGTKEMNKQLRERKKKESKSSATVSDRIRQQLRKLGKDI